MKQTLWLPWSPTVNEMFATDFKTRRRFASKRYAQWKDEAGAHLLMQRPARFDGCVQITIALCPPPRVRRWDVDNRVKPILDLLVTHRIIEDDDSKVVRRIVVEVGTEVGASVTVEAI